MYRKRFEVPGFFLKPFKCHGSVTHKLRQILYSNPNFNLKNNYSLKSVRHNYVGHWFVPTYWFWSTVFQIGNNKKFLFMPFLFFKYSSQQKARQNRLSLVSRETLPLNNSSCDFQGWAVKFGCNTAQRREDTASQQTLFTPVFVLVILALPLENC